MDLVSILINFLILLVVLGVVYWIVTMIIGAMGLPWGPMAIKIVGVICLLILLIYFLSLLGGGAPAWRFGGAPLSR